MDDLQRLQDKLRQCEEDRRLLLHFLLSKTSKDRLKLPLGATIDTIRLEEVNVPALVKNFVNNSPMIDLTSVPVKVEKRPTIVEKPQEVIFCTNCNAQITGIDSSQTTQSIMCWNCSKVFETKKDLPPLPRKPTPNPPPLPAKPTPAPSSALSIVNKDDNYGLDNSQTSFASIHLQLGDSISRKVKELPRIPPEEWILEERQFQFASYECLILSHNFQVDKEITLERIRPSLDISTKKHSQILLQLQVPIDQTVEQKCSLEYRYLLLKTHKTVPQNQITADMFKEFKDWKERQMAILYNGVLHYLLNVAGVSSVALPDREVSCYEFLDNLRFLLTRIHIALDEAEHDNYVNHLETYITSLHTCIKRDQLGYPQNITNKLYCNLLLCCFDEEEGSISNLPEVRSALAAFRRYYGISDVYDQLCLTKCWFSVFKKSVNLASLEGLQKSWAIAMGHTHISEGEISYRKEILQDIETWLHEKLIDYRILFNRDTSLFKPLLQFYREIKGPNFDFEKELETISTNTARKEYDRFVKRPLTVETFSTMLPVLLDQIKFELEFFSSQIKTTNPYFFNELAKQYTLDAELVFKHCSVLTVKLAEIQQQMQEIEDQFRAVGVTSGLPDLVGLYSQMVTKFIEEQEFKFSQVIERLVSSEKWEPVSGENRYSSSVTDMFTMFIEASPFAFPLKIPSLMEFFLGTTTGSINRMIKAYASSVTEICGLRQALLPTSANRSVKGKKQTMFVNFVKQNDNIPALSPHVIQKLNFEHLSQLCVKLNSLNYAQSQLEKLERVFKDRAESLHSSIGLKIDPQYWKGIFSSSEHLLRQATEEMLQFIATRVVFFDLRGVLLEQLYIPNVKEGHQVSTVLSSLDPLLANISQLVSDDLRALTSTRVLSVFWQGYEYVLLYGGPDRQFEPKDSDTLMEELLAVQDFFMCKDEKGIPQGLTAEEVANCSVRIKCMVANLFEYASDFLAEQYSSCPADPKVVLSKQNIAAILVHRTDKKARDFIKSIHETNIYKAIKRGAIVLS